MRAKNSPAKRPPLCRRQERSPKDEATDLLPLLFGRVAHLSSAFMPRNTSFANLVGERGELSLQFPYTQQSEPGKDSLSY
jgi:hypothetical protein